MFIGDISIVSIVLMGFINQLIIELDDGKIYRKALYVMVKTNGFPVDFPLNQSIELT